jgi:hypothetical protein
MTRLAICAGALAAAAALTPARAALAAPTKEECVEAHGKGQDARTAGQLAEASRLFLACAQPACPDLVRGDCARFAEEVARDQPTVTFAARDADKNDLPDTAVYVDGVLAASKLGDGKAHEIDPGKHLIRFVHAGKDVMLDVVINQGEKGRALVGNFAPAPSAGAPPAVGAATAAPPRDAPPELKRPAGPLVLVGLGAAAAVAGGVLFGAGFATLPSNCSLSTHQCAAPPGDAVFDKASSATTLVNVGGIAGGAGLLVFGGSLIWYFSQAPRPADPPRVALVPHAGRDGAGLTLRGVF